ncbi:hypothetical protein AQI88_06405 [Streptomyces cellostaticus]|uniref:Uncharacterized protein n=1 Tax=Streptomyces cellostaticus TaxID=67285 RepID=A0A101NQU7_9ACTN|nr:hypothetical protein [Streptomyces cellostaticus]KUM97710.1 hypothetical protein AQI88_06405 [Streptomyces cellostaticus]
MTSAPRELLGPHRLVLDVRDRPGPAPLRFERADGGRLLLRQEERPLLLGRPVGGPCCPDLYVHRLDGHRSPLPPLSAAMLRSSVNWPHQYARWLDEADGTPLHDGRWELSLRTTFQPGIWTEDFLREWPGGRLELYCGGGWHGVVPLRPLSPPDAGRVKAYRKHVREGTLAPVLVWWVPFLDGWLILDGHDRAVAALAEGRTPQCVVLTRVCDEELWRRDAEAVTEGHRHHMERLTARPATPATSRQRAAMEQNYGDVMAGLSYDPSDIRSWPLPGGAPAWDALAGAAMFQFPSD